MARDSQLINRPSRPNLSAANPANLPQSAWGLQEDGNQSPPCFWVKSFHQKVNQASMLCAPGEQQVHTGLRRAGYKMHLGPDQQVAESCQTWQRQDS